jgi:hypothetical protein
MPKSLGNTENDAVRKRTLRRLLHLVVDRKYSRFLLWVCVSSVLVLDASAAETQQLNNGLQKFKIQEGGYLLEAYINVLMRTHEPRGAAKQIVDPQYFQANRTAGGYRLTLLNNFHEGFLSLDLDEDGKSLNSKIDGIVSSSNFLPIDSKSFSIIYHGKKLIYRYIGNLAQFVNEQTIAGVYVDSNNVRYQFTSDGFAVFPDKKFRFSVEVDPISFTSFEFYYEEAPTHPWPIFGFKIKNRKLLIYDVLGDGPGELSKKPRLVLVRTTAHTSP